MFFRTRERNCLWFLKKSAQLKWNIQFCNGTIGRMSQEQCSIHQKHHFIQTWAPLKEESLIWRGSLVFKRNHFSCFSTQKPIQLFPEGVRLYFQLEVKYSTCFCLFCFVSLFFSHTITVSLPFSPQDPLSMIHSSPFPSEKSRHSRISTNHDIWSYSKTRYIPSY